jgi:hypothetical protein
VREIFIADTDAEAGACPGRQHGPHDEGIPFPSSDPFGFTGFLKHKADVPDSDVARVRARTNWLVGTRHRDRAARGSTRSGRFGTILPSASTHGKSPAWRHSMELLAREVMPRFKDLVPK